MTGEVKDGSRKRWHQRSNSTIGDFTATATTPIVERKDVFQKAPSTKGKVTGKDLGRSWFKSKKAQIKESDQKEHPGTTYLEVEEKPVQRVVQGLYRDDDGGPSPKILVTSHSAARDAIKEFSKDFLAQLKANPNECVTMEAQMREHFTLAADCQQSDLKFLVQAYITHLFFADFENASFGISNPGERPWEVQQHMLSCFEQFQKYRTKTQTVSKLLENKLNDTVLSKFCMKKFATLVPLDVGSFFGGDSEHYVALGKGIHPDTPFYRSFLSAAVSMWLLQRLAFSFEQKLVTIYPTSGDAFQRRFMEPVVPGIGDTEDEEGDVDLEIVFTVFPGFRVSESIVESLVYIVEKPKTEDPASTSVDSGRAEEDQSASKKLVVPASSSIRNGAAAEVGQSATKKSPFHKLYSLPASTSAKLSESSAIKVPQKSSSLQDDSHSKDGDHGRFFQKIFSKITRKKALGTKDKVGDDSSTTGATEATAALPYLEEVPPALPEALATDAKQDTAVVNPSGPGENSPLQPPNLEVVTSSLEQTNPASGAVDDRLYIPRSQRAAPLQSPLRSPQLSSVD